MRIFLILALCSFVSCTNQDESLVSQFSEYMHAVYTGDAINSYKYLSESEKKKWKSFENYQKVQKSAPKAMKMVLSDAHFEIKKIHKISEHEREILVKEYLPDFNDLIKQLIPYMAPYRKDHSEEQLELILQEKIESMKKEKKIRYILKENKYVLVKENKLWKIVK